MTAVSAHRGGGEHEPEGTYEAYWSAPATGAEYVEFDIRRTARRAGCAHKGCPGSPRVLATGSGWAVVHRRLARTGVLAGCRRSGLKTAVWKVHLFYSG